MPFHALTIRDAGFSYRNVWHWSKVEGLHLRWTPCGMPKLSQHLSNAVFFLYEKNPNAPPTSDNYLGPLGTGVIVTNERYWAGPTGPRNYYAVTAAHVARSGASIIKINTKAGPARAIEFDPCEWVADMAREDLAIVDITDRVDPATDAISYITLDTFADRQFLSSPWVEFGIGEDGFMLGLFSEHTKTDENIVAARFGNVSMLADDLAPIEREDPDLKITWKTPCHVFDMHSRPGFSGSPVFVYRTPDSDLSDMPLRTRRFKLADPQIVHRQSFSLSQEIEVEDCTKIEVFMRLFGIHVAQFHDEVTITKVEKHRNPELKDGDTIRFPGSMTMIVPAWEIEHLLEHPELKAQREDRERRKKAEALANPKRGAVVLERGTKTQAEPADANPAHKEDFMSLLGAAATKNPQGS